MGVPAVGGLKISIAQKKFEKVPVGGTLGRTIFSNFVSGIKNCPTERKGPKKIVLLAVILLKNRFDWLKILPNP